MLSNHPPTNVWFVALSELLSNFLNNEFYKLNLLFKRSECVGDTECSFMEHDLSVWGAFGIGLELKDYEEKLSQCYTGKFVVIDGYTKSGFARSFINIQKITCCN